MDGLEAAAANGLGQCVNRSSEGFRFTLLCNRPEPTLCLDSLQDTPSIACRSVTSSLPLHTFTIFPHYASCLTLTRSILPFGTKAS